MSIGAGDSYGVPSSVHLEERTTMITAADTPRSGNTKGEQSSKAGATKKRNGEEDSHIHSNNSGQVDAYENPTDLFQWINFGNYQAAAAHALDNPSEAKIWIVSRRQKSTTSTTATTSISASTGKNGGDPPKIKWKYLPLHLACMPSNPSEDLINALVFAYPGAARERDYDGNLPIHYLLSEGCENKDIIETLLNAYPESIDKPDRKGRSLIEIVSDGFRTGKLEKESMINTLAVLRQWTANEDRSMSGNLPYEQRILQKRGGHEDFREDPELEATARSAFTFDEIDENPNRRGKKQSHRRSKSKGATRRAHESSDIFRTVIHDEPARNGEDDLDVGLRDAVGKKISRDVLEGRLDNALAERDIFCRTVGKLKAQIKNQEKVILSLNQQAENATVEQQRSKEKVQKKKELVDELQQQLKEQADRFKNHEQIFCDKEQKLKFKDKQLRELSDRVVKLVAENGKLRGTVGVENAQLSTRMLHLEEENQDLRDRVSRYQASKSRSKVIEQERFENSSQGTDGNALRLSEMSLFDDERKALKEMNASLQEHVGALKERCKHLEEAAGEKKDLQQIIQRLEGELIHARQKQTEHQEEVEQIRSESSIIESRLQTKLAKVEMELLEIQGAQETESVTASIDDEKAHEERRALRDMNASLKEHVTALMAKCCTLEKSLSELREKNVKLGEEMKNANADTVRARVQQEQELTELRKKNAALVDELSLAKFDDIGERQKELHSEFHNLFNMVKGIANGGPGAESNSETSTVQYEALRNRNDSLKTQCDKAQSEIVRLRAELIKHRDKQVSIANLKELQADLTKATEKAAYYKEEVKELVERLDLAKSTIANLREIISKNNGTYISKVELLTSELDDLRLSNESLRSHIHGLSQENEGLRRIDFVVDHNDDEQRRRLGELISRLNHVAGYLIALSLLWDEEDEGGRGLVGEHRDELRDEVLRRQESLLSSDGRDEIVEVAKHIGPELRSGPRHPPSHHLSGPRTELNSISAIVQNFR